jgi:DNA-binding NtrC family response regulator
MVARRVLLVGVGAALREAFERAGAQSAARCVSVEGREVTSVPADPFSLCVARAECDGRASAAFRRLHKALAPTPIVLLAGTLSVDRVVEILRAGAADLIDVSHPSAEPRC